MSPVNILATALFINLGFLYYLGYEYGVLATEYNLCMDLHEPGVSAVPVD